MEDIVLYRDLVTLDAIITAEIDSADGGNRAHRAVASSASLWPQVGWRDYTRLLALSREGSHCGNPAWGMSGGYGCAKINVGPISRRHE